MISYEYQEISKIKISIESQRKGTINEEEEDR